MSEKVQDFRGLSALLLGNQAERPGKHRQRTTGFSLATLIPHCLYGPGKYPIKPAVEMERKWQMQVRQKQHRAEPVLALSSAFVIRDPRRKVVAEA